MALNISNFSQLVKYSNALVPSECLADRKTATATLHTTEDSQHLPQLHLTFRPNHFVMLTKEEAVEARKLGYTVEESSQSAASDGRPFFCYAQEKAVRHLWFMNFRRYAWSWTEDSTGEYGYGRGVTYANGPAISHLADSPAEKIRDAMVHAWSEALGRGLLPEYFDDAEVHALLRWMLDDAIAHATVHSTVRPPYKGFGYIKVTKTSALPGKPAPKPAKKTRAARA